MQFENLHDQAMKKFTLWYDRIDMCGYTEIFPSELIDNILNTNTAHKYILPKGWTEDGLIFISEIKTEESDICLNWIIENNSCLKGYNLRKTANIMGGIASRFSINDINYFNSLKCGFQSTSSKYKKRLYILEQLIGQHILFVPSPETLSIYEKKITLDFKK